MMDFKTPERTRYSDPRPVHRRPAAAAPAVPKPDQVSDMPHSKRRSKRMASRWIKAILVIVIIGIIGGLAYGYASTKHQLNQLNSPGASGQSQSSQLQGKIGKLVQLPANEKPTIATVNDASKLKDQAFFADAQNGDKVLIYSKSQKAVLYRPSTNKIIQYSSVNLSGGTGQ